MFPAPAIGTTSTREVNGKDEDNTSSRSKLDVTPTDNRQLTPGSLPAGATEISNAARSLLKRLLELEPTVRLKSIRQLQQTAFYMGFNFEHVKAKKVSPKIILERCIPVRRSNELLSEQEFTSFDDFKCPL